MPIKTIDSRIDINASPEQVWQVLTDWPSYPYWNPFIVGLHGKLQRGARLCVTLHPPQARRMTFRPTLIELEPGLKLVWRGTLLAQPLFCGEHAFELEALDAGTTRLHQHETFRGLLTPLFSETLLTHTRNGFVGMNEAVKKRAETLASAGTA